MLTLQNVAALVNLGTLVDLDHIKNEWPEATYNYQRFHGLIMKTPLATITLFKTGKMMVVGAPDEMSATVTAAYISNQLRDLGYNSSVQDFKITNMVASGRMPKKINFLAFCSTHGIMYEPELFPGARYRDEENKISVIFFHTGKLFLTGGKSEDLLEKSYEKFCTLINGFE